MMDESMSIGEEAQRLREAALTFNPPAVYRQCNDEQCPAWLLELPHSHLEEPHEMTAKLEEFKHQWLGVVNGNNTAVTVVPSALEEAPVRAWVSIPLDGDMAAIMQMIGEYVTWVETAQTKDVCKCEWIQHPRNGLVRSGETALDCPAYSKEGLLLGFMEWLKQHGG